MHQRLLTSRELNEPKGVSAFRRRLMRLAASNPTDDDVFNEIRQLIREVRPNEASILAGLWFDENVDELGNMWWVAKHGKTNGKELNDKLYELRMDLRQRLKTKLNGSVFAKLCDAMRPLSHLY